GRGQNAFGAREFKRCIEDWNLGVGAGLDVPEFAKVAEKRRRSVVAQAARVDAGRNEIVTEGIHLDQRGKLRGVPEIVSETALSETGAGGRFDRQNAWAFARQAIENVGQCEASEIAAAAKAPDYDLGLFARFSHLELGLLPNHRLVQHDVIQHAA